MDEFDKTTVDGIVKHILLKVVVVHIIQRLGMLYFLDFAQLLADGVQSVVLIGVPGPLLICLQIVDETDMGRSWSLSLRTGHNPGRRCNRRINFQLLSPVVKIFPVIVLEVPSSHHRHLRYEDREEEIEEVIFSLEILEYELEMSVHLGEMFIYSLLDALLLFLVKVLTS